MQTRNLLRNALLLASLVPATAALAGDGDLDPAFGPSHDGRLVVDFDLGSSSVDVASDVVVFPDRSIAVVGGVSLDNTIGTGVLHLTANGALHPDWQTTILDPGNGISIVPLAMTTQVDGSLVIGGFYATANSPEKWIACRLDATGALDAGFGNDVLFGCTTHFADSSELVGQIRDVVVQPGGRIIFAGHALDGMQKKRATLSSLRSDGVPDFSFADDGVGVQNIIVPFPEGAPTSEFSSIALGHNGFFSAAGSYELSSADSDFIVTYYQTSGAPVATFGANGRVTDSVNVGPAGHRRDRAERLAIVNGQVFVAGTTERDADGSLAAVVRKYDAKGIVDQTFGTDGMALYSPNASSTLLTGMAVSANGEMLLAGALSEAGSMKQFGFVARVTSDGSFDQTFGKFGSVSFDFATPANEIASSAPRAIAMQGDRAIVVGRASVVADPDNNVDFGVARIGDGGIFSDGFEPSGG